MGDPSPHPRGLGVRRVRPFSAIGLVLFPESWLILNAHHWGPEPWVNVLPGID